MLGTGTRDGALVSAAAAAAAGGEQYSVRVAYRFNAAESGYTSASDSHFSSILGKVTLVCVLICYQTCIGWLI